VADFSIAYKSMLDHEDRAREYKTVPDAPPGAFAISGINSASFPAEFGRINAVSQEQRAGLVEMFYETHFWNNWLGLLNSDEVAKRVFDACVNMGPVAPVKMLQECCGAVPDGHWGPDTVGRANACDPLTLVNCFAQARVAHYQQIVAAKPEMSRYLPAWTARAEA
jgi:lysozyme family protein